MNSVSPREMNLELPHRPEAPKIARLAAFDLIQSDDPTLAQDVELLLSEVVTNAVRHTQAGPDTVIEIRLRVSDDIVRAEVRDRGPGFDPANPNAERGDRIGGWGLKIVRTLATRWGVKVDDGTCVWFELERRRSPQNETGSQQSGSSRSLGMSA